MVFRIQQAYVNTQFIYILETHLKFNIQYLKRKICLVYTIMLSTGESRLAFQNVSREEENFHPLTAIDDWKLTDFLCGIPITISRYLVLGICSRYSQNLVFNVLRVKLRICCLQSNLKRNQTTSLNNQQLRRTRGCDSARASLPPDYTNKSLLYTIKHQCMLFDRYERVLDRVQKSARFN